VTPACDAPTAGTWTCFALFTHQAPLPATSANRADLPGGPNGGYTPAQLVAAYGLGPYESRGGSETVGIVDAFNDPHAQGDLNAYRSQFGLPPCGAGCFSQVSQTGSATALPKENNGWAAEESLDIEMVSAICPHCHILLVEAKSDTYRNLGLAVDEAVNLGASVVSNSYGANEQANEQSFDQYFNHPGIPILASTGDAGYGVQYPASSNDVVAVGGTSLTPNANTARGWTESAWTLTGAGCSTKEPALAWQQAIPSLATACAKRAVADIAADADPGTGVAVYDSTPDDGYQGWNVIGGTSASSPIVAAVFALAGGVPASISAGRYLYAHAAGNLNDVTSGGSSGTCTATVLCMAGTGWDGPTGLGTPKGIGAF
jgi:subtilase family serine protease